MTLRLNKVAGSSPESAKTRLAKIPPTRLAENQAPAPKESQAQTVIALPRSDPTARDGHSSRVRAEPPISGASGRARADALSG
jgi:hypothetical protein